MAKLKIDDYSIDKVELRKIKTTIKEVDEMLSKENTCIYNREYPQKHAYAIGYLDGRKFIPLAYEIPKNHIFDIKALQIGIPDGEEIKRYWCKQGNRD